ncbi:hypothetical protein [Nocardia abscessus]|uniref:hypothetical protein n=1 Tax=Nocardia abscessus TaxID=120957 RepID=UPI0024553224|nr:hypothetical protein [Nocardia abscessus]
MPTDPWQTLAARARQLAELADQYAAIAPADLAPTTAGDPLAELDALAREIARDASACRRATYQALHDTGVPKSEIGRRWGTTGAAVGKVLNRDQTAGNS